MKTKETTLQKLQKYERWILNPSYIEQELKGGRLLLKLENELDKYLQD